METEERLYALIAHAEEIQTHALDLQKSVRSLHSSVEKVSQENQKHLEDIERRFKKSLSEISSHIDESKSKIAGQAIIGSASVLGISAIICVIVVLSLLVYTESLREEVGILTKESRALQKNVEDFEARAGKAILTDCGGRLCIEVDKQNVKYSSDNNRIFYIINGY